MNDTPNAERIHIGIFGRRNAGKSSLMNAITGQDLSIVSDTLGTTTDPVLKAMELLPLGPVVLIDTPGLDDSGELGALRVKKAYQTLNKTDIALLVIDCAYGKSAEDERLLEKLIEKNIPYLVVYNKADLTDKTYAETANEIMVSAVTGLHIQRLKELLAGQIPTKLGSTPLVSDLIEKQDIVILVVPIDSAAPKGRLILPQQQTIREIIESGGMAFVTQVEQLEQTLSSLKGKPKLVITDSQAFESVAEKTPQDIMLTSFSILFARYKGSLWQAAEGVKALNQIQAGDKILISEGCTHHRQCGDIGTVKLPAFIKKFTGVTPEFIFTSGQEFPAELSAYQLIIHCGGCMLNDREMRYRQKCAADAAIPMTNYGMAIAYMKGILQRSLLPFQ